MTTIVCTEDARNLVEPIAIRLYDPRPRYREGGLHSTAETVRGAGRFGDDVLLHVTPDEFEQLQHAWGAPTINPVTGLPEYGLLSKLGKGLKNVGNKVGSVAKKVLQNPIVQKLGPIAANFFLPGVGGLIASAALGAVNSKLSGGNALKGALSGSLGHFISGGGMGVGDAATHTVSNLVGANGESPGGGGILGKIFGGVGGGGNIGAEGVGASGGGGGILGSLKGMFTNPSTGGPAWGKIAGAGAGALALLGGIGANNKPTAPPPLPAQFSQPLQRLQMNREQIPMTDRSYLTYGEDPLGEHQFFTNPTYTPKAGGGGIRGPGSGRDDKIDALLSDGEYVFDAESVAMLGDGSLDEGARRLDEMRQNLRRHKGAVLAKGKFSPDAKRPEDYIKKAKGGPMDSRAFWNSEKSRVRSKIEQGVYDGPSEKAGMEQMLGKISSKVEARAEGGRIRGDWVRRVVEGGAPKRSLEDRAADLASLQRMIDAYKQAQDAAAKAKDELGIAPESPGIDPYNTPPKPKLTVVKAQGGAIKDAQARVATILALAKKPRKAEGGPVAALTTFADRLEEALQSNNRDRVDEIQAQLGDIDKNITAHYAEGGKVKPDVIAAVLDKYKVQNRSPEVLRAMADELRKLNPQSDTLRMYDTLQQKKAAAGQ